MASVNSGIILSKVRDFAKSERGKRVMQGKIDYYKKNNIKKTAAGATIITEDMMHDIALDLIHELQNAAMTLRAYGVLPDSVESHFDSLSADVVKSDGDGGYKVDISFTDDLHRDSLIALYGGIHSGRRTGRSIDNIVALFNNGYSARGSVFGYWENAGVYTWSTSARPHLGFMESTIDDFNARYAATGCYAKLSPVYDDRW